jgi:hypothetical protein
LVVSAALSEGLRKNRLPEFKAFKIVVGFSSGSGYDTYTRVLAPDCCIPDIRTSSFRTWPASDSPKPFSSSTTAFPHSAEQRRRSCVDGDLRRPEQHSAGLDSQPEDQSGKFASELIAGAPASVSFAGKLIVA